MNDVWIPHAHKYFSPLLRLAFFTFHLTLRLLLLSIGKHVNLFSPDIYYKSPPKPHQYSYKSLIQSQFTFFTLHNKQGFCSHARFQAAIYSDISINSAATFIK